jgi:hypothetical protein
MARRYGINTSQAISSTAATNTYALSLTTAASRTALIYEVIYGMSAAVQDAQIRADIFGVSALTAGSAATPVPIDVGSTAAVTTASTLPTAVTTTGLSLLEIWYNSRATVRWAAVDPDSVILIPAGGSTGGEVVFSNQQPGTVASMNQGIHAFFKE